MFNASRLTAFLAVSIGSLALTATAAAAERVASDTGSGTACTAAAPCSLRTAVELAGSGDDVVVRPGRYNLNARLELPMGATGLIVHGAAGQPRPRISTNGDVGLWVHAGQTVRDLEIEHTGSSTGLFVSGGTAERVYVHTTGDVACGPYSEAGSQALLRDSVCWNTRSGPGGWAISTAVGSTAPVTEAPRVRNVTAVTTSPSEPAVSVSAGANTTISFDARNLIALAPGVDVRAGTSAPGATANVTLRTSNFANLAVSGNSSISSPSSNGNQSAAPAFADASAGDFHQAASSPTVDAGSVDDRVGSLDLDRETRVQNGTIDIGADERTATPVTPPTGGGDTPPGGGEEPPAADTDPPEVTFDRAPLRRSTRRRATFGFTADEPVTYECSLDGRPARPCSSPSSYRRLRSGRHTFVVYATDAAGNADPTPATYRWRVRR